MGFVEDELQQLKDIISTLDSRIKRLEQRATGYPPSTEEIRMILIGPPGAGAHHPACCFPPPPHPLFPLKSLTTRAVAHRQGNAGPQDQGALLLLPPGESTILPYIDSAPLTVHCAGHW